MVEMRDILRTDPEDSPLRMTVRFHRYVIMWGRMGDASKGPPGTYYYDDSSHVNYFWHTFDQVILRPALLDYFSDEKLEVITQIAGQSLLKPNGKPDAVTWSDHLPLMFSLDIEKRI